VYKTGRIGHIKTIRSLDPVYDKMVVNIIKSLPQFIPGKINGQPVNVWYTLPLTFKIQEI
jgi:protein TonB